MISLKNGASLKGGVDYSLTFTLHNPVESQASPAVTVSAANLGSFVLTSGSGNLAPLLVAGFGVCCIACAPFCPCGVDGARRPAWAWRCLHLFRSRSCSCRMRRAMWAAEPNNR